ncbi:fumarylacetoacetate hydrolase family protein [Leisingera sp. S232]|uniref:fumarylacetoacetate hydrolase family protein n=1 Tax=Leisingera sp. S232 TaxID=3415132 RepID=UPI003C7C1EC4
MKLLRYRVDGEIRPGLLDNAGAVRDLSAHVPDFTGAQLGDETLSRLAALDPLQLPLAASAPELAPCVGQVGKLLCIGLNYTDHAEEMGMALPEHPILFLKATSSISGANDDVVLPRGSVATDWEVELGAVIGTKAKYVAEEEALNHVAGYCVVNDVSERDFQTKLAGQWTKGKSCDTFGPVGPWLVTRDEVEDPQKLWLTCDVNGTRRQTGSTSRMVFSVAQIISHLSQLMTLHPGDVIATGTPPGVGMGIKPEPVYLNPGDVMRLEIEGLGVQTQHVRADAQ